MKYIIQVSSHHVSGENGFSFVGIWQNEIAWLLGVIHILREFARRKWMGI
jgi:hypothetical protein